MDSAAVPDSPTVSQQLRDQLEDAAAAHLRAGTLAAEQEQWEVAVREFSAALKLARPASESTLRLARSRVLASFARQLLSIPARVSERRAVFAHDPSMLGQLALKDAQRAAQLRPDTRSPAWAEACVCQAEALLLLERYSEAEAACLEGLVLHPGHAALTQGLARVQTLLAEEQEQAQLLADVRAAGVDNGSGSGDGGGRGGGPQQGSPSRRARGSGSGDGGPEPGGGAAAASGAAAKRQRRLAAVAATGGDDLDCTLCLKLMYAPVTTPCGHSFCGSCFARALDHSHHRCPLCRTVLHVGRELPLSVTLAALLAKALPAETAARAAEEAAAAAADAGSAAPGHVTLPLFVMCTLLPGEKMALNIFEPRYRLMVRRVMEGNRRLGMAQTGHSGPDGLDEVAIEAEVLECNPLPDGRYYLELVGRRRVKIVRSWELDGYRVASAQLLHDAPLPAALAAAPAATAAAAAAAAGAEQAAAADAASAASAGADAGVGADAQPAAGAGEPATGQSVQALAADVLAAGDALANRMRGVLSSRRVGAAQVQEVFERLGEKPPASDAAAVSWWGARLLLLLVPSHAEATLRGELLPSTDAVARLQLLRTRLDVLARGGSVDASACVIM